MKTLNKIITLSLTAAFLSSCSATQSQTIDDSTVVGDSTSIVDSTENSQSPDSSDGEGVVIDLTEKEDENWLKAPEGFDSFSYDRETYYVSDYEMMYFNGNGPIDYWFDDKLPVDYNKYFEKYDVNDYVYIKARLAGDSLNILSGKCGDKALTDDMYVDGVYSPVIIEGIVDARGNDINFEIGDIIYAYEGYYKLNSYYVDTREASLEEWLFPFLKRDPDDEYWNLIYEDLHAQYEYYREHQDDNWIRCDNIYPMEKDKSYLILVKTTPIEGLSEECPPLYETGFFNMNLSDDEPDSYGEDNDLALSRYGQYKNYWHACKELYGEYFE